MNFAEKISFLRKQQRLSQEALAELVGVSRQAVAKWEAGDTLPDMEKILMISDKFRISVDTLIRDTEDCSQALDKQEKATDERTLVDFLRRAKRSTYAAKGAQLSPSRPASHDLQYTEGGYLYYDSYLGGECFSGEEAVWKGELPLWAMNYQGRVMHERFSGDFLKEALLLVPQEEPYRGPRLYAKGTYCYHMNVEGSLAWFWGREEIYWDSQQTYECLFHGGFIH